MARPFYPPSPVGVPEDLTRPSGAYPWRVALLLFVVILFFLLYFALVGGAIYLIYRGVANAGGSTGAILGKIGLIVLGVFCLLFLVRGFLRRSGRQGRSIHVKLDERDQPRLFEFIEELCAETGAPFPAAVYVSYEVNAAAAFNVSPLSILFPHRKSLLIGLGLVNVLNLTEFKAVLAHEFGHFSQTCTKFTSYAYVARNIINSMLTGEDFLDVFLERWRRAEAPVGWIGYGVWGACRLFNYGLLGVLYGIYFLDKALSREMEYHADRVAVSVAGSDAIVHALKRLTFADGTMELALHDLAFAADQRRFSRDLFHQHNSAMARVRRNAKDPNLSEPPALPDDPKKRVYIFNPDDEVNYPTMWLDHPPNHLREDNAKEVYLRSEFDERSPWLLFSDVVHLRERVTFRMYRALFRVRREQRLIDAAEVQSVIDAEHAELTYDERYHGMYDNRAINPGSLQELSEEIRNHPWPHTDLVAAHDTLYDDTVKRVAQRFEEAFQDRGVLLGVIHNPRREAEFEFRGRNYEARDAKRLLKAVGREFEDCVDWLRDRDRRVFLVYAQMAQRVGAEARRDLLERYGFHLDVQSIWQRLAEHADAIDALLAFLSNCPPRLTEADFDQIYVILRNARRTVDDCLRYANELRIPRLANLGFGRSLGNYLFQGKLADNIVRLDGTIPVKRLNKFLRQFDEIFGKSKQIHFKSMGGILQAQAAIAKVYLENKAEPATSAASNRPRA